MQMSFKVHSASEEDVPVVADINGTPMTVRVPGLTVELVSDNAGHSYRFVPTDMAEAKALFTVGNMVTVSFSAAE